MTAPNGNRAASATWLTGLTFAVLSTPLAIFGAQPMEMSLANIEIRGPLDDYAVEYLGAAAVISLGLGASRLRKASSHSEKATTNANSPLLSGSSAEYLMGWADSDSSSLTKESLKASGLDMFLDEDDAPMVVSPASLAEAPRSIETARVAHQVPTPSSEGLDAPASSGAQKVSLPTHVDNQSSQSLHSTDALASVVAEVQSIVQRLSVQSQEVVAAQTVAPSVAQQPAPLAAKPDVHVAALPRTGHHTVPIFPAAQSYASFARSQEVAEQSVTRDLTAEMAVLEQIYKVREQMHRLMNQVDLIQADLEQTVYPTQRSAPLRAAQAPSYTVNSVEPLRAPTAPASDAWTSYRATA